MRPEVTHLLTLGPLPGADDLSSEQATQYTEAIDRLPVPTAGEATALLGLLPPDESTSFGLARSLVHAIESCPRMADMGCPRRRDPVAVSPPRAGDGFPNLGRQGIPEHWPSPATYHPTHDRAHPRATDASGETYDDPSEDALFMFMEDLRSVGLSLRVERLDPERHGEWVTVSLNESGLYEFASSGHIEYVSSLREIHEFLTGWAFG